jgi:hypothetical protein
MPPCEHACIQSHAEECKQLCVPCVCTVCALVIPWCIPYMWDMLVQGCINVRWGMRKLYWGMFTCSHVNNILVHVINAFQMRFRNLV